MTTPALTEAERSLLTRVDLLLAVARRRHALAAHEYDAQPTPAKRFVLRDALDGLTFLLSKYGAE